MKKKLGDAVRRLGNRLKLLGIASVFLAKAATAHDALPMQGTFRVEHWRDGRCINAQVFKNQITTVGKNYLLNVGFHADSQISTWYVGLVDNASFSAFSAADTMSSHAGWIENDDYDESTRVEWTEGAASAASITNATAITFTMNATATIKGIFINSVSTKNGTTGTLWTAVAFASNVSVVDDDQLKVTYTLSC